MTIQPVGWLSLRTSPKEVVSWGHQRDSIPSITDVQQFQEKWITWWGSCQPKWRAVETWPFSRDGAEDKDWARLNVTGPHGLFAIVMSTSWWAASTNQGSHSPVFDAAVTDLRWVIEQLTENRLGTGMGQANKFPGHGNRAPGKRQIKPSSKSHG